MGLPMVVTSVANEGIQAVHDENILIADTPAELVVIGTPIDLRRLIDIDKPTARVRYELQEIGSPTLAEVLQGFGD